MSESLRESILLIVQIASLIGLFIYVVKTAEMAKQTKKSASAMEKSIEEMVEDRDTDFAPYIVVYFDAQTDSPIFDLVVKNTGKTIARNVKISFDPPLKTSLKNYNIDQLALIHQPIPALPPGFEIRTSIDRLETRLNSDLLPKVYKVRVTCTGGLNDRIRQLEYILDLRMFHGILETHTSSMTDLTHAVEQISRSVEHLSDQIERLPKTLENNGEIVQAIQKLDETIKSKENKIW